MLTIAQPGGCHDDSQGDRPAGHPRRGLGGADRPRASSSAGSRTTSSSTCAPAATRRFRWGNGESRHATVTEVEPGERLAFEWDDEGEVEFTLDDDADGTRLTVVETSPAWTTALGLQASRARADALTRLGQVFSALADPSRRHVLGYLADHGTATATELTGELPMTRQAVSKHLATLSEAGLVSSRARGRETRYRLTEAGDGVGRAARRAAAPSASGRS